MLTQWSSRAATALTATIAILAAGCSGIEQVGSSGGSGSCEVRVSFHGKTYSETTGGVRVGRKLDKTAQPLGCRDTSNDEPQEQPQTIYRIVGISPRWVLAVETGLADPLIVAREPEELPAKVRDQLG